MKRRQLKRIVGGFLVCLLSFFLGDLERVSAATGVEVLTVSTAKQYSLANAEQGVDIYIDRNYVITKISPRLLGGTLVQTANDDKRASTDTHLILQLNQNADVFVCYDKRAQSLPGWLENGTWSLTGETILSTDAPAGPMLVYSTWVAAGTVMTLGGNLSTGAAGAQSNYFVIVKPAELPPPIEPLAVNFVSSGKGYMLAALDLEVPCYIDRTYTVTQISPGLEDALLIQTANDDKYVDHANHLQLHFNETATVYICYDRRANTLPSWLNSPDWMPTPESIASTDSLAGPMHILARSVSAGEDLTLGGNHEGGDTGARSNYLVAFKFLSGDPPQPQATFTAAPAIVSAGNTAELEWRTFYAQSCRIEPEIGPVGANGSVTVSPSETTLYVLVGEGPGGVVRAEAEVVVVPNQPPTIELLEPDGSNDTADGTYSIKWLAEDPDNNATISLYYDSDNEGADGSLIVEGLFEDTAQPAEDGYVWDTAQLWPGNYYVYAIIDDGVNVPFIAYGNKPVTIRHFTSGDKITPLDAETGGFFGRSVALSGDYAIAGAFRSSSYTGAAYIFKQEETGWVQQAKLTPPALYGHFGTSVAVDGNFAVVGNPREHSPYRYQAGAAYVYKLEGAQWVADKRVAADLSYESAWFGDAVAISGDFIIVGAPGDSELEFDAGAAYIFEKQGNYWWQVAKLMVEDAARNDHFGSSVSINGDYAIVGANYAWQDEEHIGAAYIFKREGDSWIQQAKLTAGAKNFAKSVAIDNNLVVIGAYDLNLDGLPSGAVYIFSFDGNRWVQEAKLKGSDTVPYENFGCAVSIQGDYIAVGSNRHHEDGIFRGTTYLFKRIGSNWVELTKHVARGAETHDYFGYSVSVDDGRLLVGAYGDQEDVFYSGAAYIFPFLSSSIEASPPAIAPGDSTTLSWSTRYADTCSIEPGIGSVALEGSVVVEPAETTTYFLTAAGAEGTDTAMVTVTVSDPPAASLAAAPGTIYPGESATLAWSCQNAESCTIEPGIGAVESAGTVSISPNETTTYTLNAVASGRVTTSTATVAVVYPVPTVTLVADPIVLVAGETAILTWASTDAHAVTFDNGIGDVDLNGTLSVNPTQTTTYTLTASGTGGSASSITTITVNPAVPAAELSASPENIQGGESSVLSWSSSNAESLVIEPDIGAVDAGGSLQISPAATTTYTLTAAGPGGSIEKNVTVTVTWPSPSVQITADPSLVQNGEGVTLSWTSSHADICTIEPGIGNVAPNGSIQLAPTQTTIYRMLASGPGGSTTAEVTVIVSSPIQVLIDSPADGDIVPNRDVMVSGTVFNPAGLETGICINGLPAIVNGNRFFASHVPLSDGQNILSANARDSAGNSSSASITVNAVTSADYIKVVSSTEAGVTPLEITLTIDSSFTFSSPSVYYSGPDQVEFLDVANDDEFRIMLSTSGTYFFVVDAVDEQGNVFTDTVTVAAFESADIDELLKARWADMKSAFANRDIAKALENFVPESQALYGDIFTAFYDNLPQIAIDMEEIQMIYFIDKSAKYRIRKDELYGGAMESITYYIYFTLDDDGLWKIYRF